MPREVAAVEVAMDAGITLSYRYLIDYAIVPRDARFERVARGKSSHNSPLFLT